MRKFQFSLRAALVMRERAVEAAELALRVVQEEWNLNQQRQQDLVDEVKAAEVAVHQSKLLSTSKLLIQPMLQQNTQRVHALRFTPAH